MVDLYDAASLFSRALATLPFLPETHISAFDSYVQTLAPSSSSPYAAYHSTVLSAHGTIIAMLLALSRPTSLISTITTSRKAIERSYNSLSRSTRWPLGLLDETRKRLNEEKEDKARRAKEEEEGLGRELRYTQQVVDAELAGWQDLHGKMGRRAIRDLARAVLTKERATLEGMKRAMRKLTLPLVARVVTETNGEGEGEVDGETEGDVEGSRLNG
jgi:hypothetical protein